MDCEIPLLGARFEPATLYGDRALDAWLRQDMHRRYGPTLDEKVPDQLLGMVLAAATKRRRQQDGSE